MDWRRALGAGRRDADDGVQLVQLPDAPRDRPSNGARRASTSADAGGSGGSGDAPAADADADLKPSAMRGRELLYGYLIVAELILVSILNLVDTHGKGAPAHPARAVEIAGLVVSISLLGVLQTRHRFIAPFAMIIAAYLVAYPKTPNSLVLSHLFALVLPVIYAIVLMQRQRKASLAQVRSRTGAGGGRPARATPDQRRAEAMRRRQERQDRRRGVTPQSGPKASGRYTPPKGRRPKR